MWKRIFCPNHTPQAKHRKLLEKTVLHTPNTVTFLAAHENLFRRSSAKFFLQKCDAFSLIVRFLFRSWRAVNNFALPVLAVRLCVIPVRASVCVCVCGCEFVRLYVLPVV